MSRVLVMFVLAAALVATFATAPHHGFNFTCINGECYMMASTSLMGLVASFVLAIFVCLYPQRAGTPIYREPVKVRERFTAFFIDFFIIISIVSPVVTLPILLEEAKVTGNFQWSFERDFARPTDGALATPSVLLMFAVLFAYFYFHPSVGRQTLGQYLLGFRVEGVPGSGKQPAFGLNVFLSFIGFCMWPMSVYLALSRRDKVFWWNLRTHTRLTRLV